MNDARTSGILLHITSLPGELGVGDLGPAAFRFVDFLIDSRQGLWQVLPLGPTGYGNSPYQCYSAFAGNAALISPELLVQQGLLSAAEIAPAQDLPADTVDFDQVFAIRNRLLHRAFERFQSTAMPAVRNELTAFAKLHSSWLDDYVLYRAIKEAHGGDAWTSWEPAARARDPQALGHWRSKLAREIEYETFLQFEFFRQWNDLKHYANERGISIIGDLPIFVAHDSADVWAHQDLFALEADGFPTVVAGVPPDYFCATGQLWGNPLYRWEEMAATGYDWWIGRLRSAMELFDRIRLDHFRGFEAYWEVPGDAEVAINGRWAPGPGADFFNAVQQALGKVSLIAEDLGVITPEVEALRDQFGFPGMRVLQFAFGDDPKSVDYQPHNYPRHTVVYTGTHDNDTAVGWFNSGVGEGTTRALDQIETERAFTLKYLGTDGSEIHWDLIRLALASVADTAIFPLQDVLGLGTKARMNIPGTAAGNWSWRFRWEMLTPDIAARLAEMSETYQRNTSLPSRKPI